MAPQRIVILSGHPTDVEVAAITAALQRHRSTTTATREPQAAIHRRRPSTTLGRASRWARAARLEGCGHPPIGSPTEFRG